MTDPRVPSIPDVPEGLNEDLERFLEAVRIRLIVDSGEVSSVSDKRPTVQDMIDAGIANADKIT